MVRASHRFGIRMEAMKEAGQPIGNCRVSRCRKSWNILQRDRELKRESAPFVRGGIQKMNEKLKGRSVYDFVAETFLERLGDIGGLRRGGRCGEPPSNRSLAGDGSELPSLSVMSQRWDAAICLWCC